MFNRGTLPLFFKKNLEYVFKFTKGDLSHLVRTFLFFKKKVGTALVIMSRIERPDDRTGDNINYTNDLKLLINNLDIDKESKTVEYSKSNFC